MSTNQQAVAVVGAGVAGLVAARRLASAGVTTHVFDKGRGLGGRLATRRDESGGHFSGGQFDHGAQYFTASSHDFEQQVHRWVDAGVVARWMGRLVGFEADAEAAWPSSTPEAKARYVGVPEMRSVATQLAQEAIAAGAQITSGIEVAPLKRPGPTEGWRLTSAAGEPLGVYGRVLVTAPAPQSAELLSASPSLANAAKSVRTTGCWAVMATFRDPIASDFDGAFVRGPESALSWVARDSSKPGREVPAGGPERWVLHGAPGWSQPRLDLAPDDVVQPLLEAFHRLVGESWEAPLSAVAHRWRYALPETPLQEPAISDLPMGLYAAGDWCGGPRVEGAYLSGLAAAEAILRS